MMDRPFFNYLTKELIAEVERSKANPERLRLLLDEMTRRKRAANQLKPHIDYVKQLIQGHMKNKQVNTHKKESKAVNDKKRDASDSQHVLPITRKIAAFTQGIPIPSEFQKLEIESIEDKITFKTSLVA